jgi:hypothetical protein
MFFSFFSSLKWEKEQRRKERKLQTLPDSTTSCACARVSVYDEAGEGAERGAKSKSKKKIGIVVVVLQHRWAGGGTHHDTPFSPPPLPQLFDTGVN